MYLSLFVLAAIFLIGTLAVRHWSYVRTWLRVAWVCRISVTSAGLGLLMMSCVPQAQDVFLETDTQWYLWLAFAAALLLWAIPVHYGARRILEKTFWSRSFFDPIPPGDLAARFELIRRSHRHAIAFLPRIVGFVPFVAVMVGLVMAYLNLSSYAGLAASAEAIPRLIWLAVATVVAAALYVAYVVKRPKYESATGLRGLHEDTIFSMRRFPQGDDGAEQRSAEPQTASLVDAAMRTTGEALRRVIQPDVQAVLFTAVSFALLAFAILAPFALTDHVLRRATFLCVMLGVWVLPLTLVAMAAHRVRAPLVFLMFCGFALSSWVVARQHDMRTVPAQASGTVQGRQITLNEAAMAWMRANGCEGRAMDCPPPLIVAAQGGASRAAFFTNTVLGDLLDRTRSEEGQAVYRDFGRQLFALSSVSGSSLGAVVTRAALDDAGGDPASPAWRRGPCRSSERLWFGFNGLRDDTGTFTSPQTWTACLQTLTAGDFLSPVFVGLAFRDWAAFPADLRGTPLWLDRSALLETAFERFYARHVATTAVDSRGDASVSGLERRFGYPAPRAERWRPLLLLNGTSVETGRRILAAELKPWHRLDATFSPLIGEGGACTQALFSEAYDLFELLAVNKSAEAKTASRTGACWPAPQRDTEAAASAPDLTLSTAVLVSARFPLISTDGVIRDRSGQIVDRIVDGGYFENDGLVTASEVADALKRVCTVDERGSGCLRPVIVRITNEPDALLAEPWRRIRPSSGPPLPDGADRDLLGSVLAPLRGLYNTRSGHGAEAALTALKTVERSEGPAHFIRVQVKQRLQLDGRRCGDLVGQETGTPVEIENPKISMSWWLSQPVQAYLDCHRKDADYIRQIEAVLCHLAQRPVRTQDGGCTAAPPGPTARTQASAQPD